MQKTIFISGSNVYLNSLKRRGLLGSIFNIAIANLAANIASKFRFSITEAQVRIGVKNMVTATYIID